MKLILYRKKIVVFSEVTSKLFFEEKRQSDNGGNVSSEDLALAVDTGKGNSKNNVICWGFGQSRYLKRNSRKGGANSARSSRFDDVANTISFAGDYEFVL